jgi:prepilin-type N-terminal cleavage/methylation domain-containing protein
MPRRTDRSREGFTLIEILISVSIFALVLIGIYNLFDTSRATYVSGQRKVDVQQNARAALDEIVREIRMTGYFPENFPTPPTPPLANPIQVATNAALAVHGDLDGSGASQVFLFCLDGSLLRRRVAAQGNVSAYTCPSGSGPIPADTVLAEYVTSLSFTYLAADNTPIPNPPTAPYQLDSQALGAAPSFATTIQRGAVSTVLITLTATEVVPGQQPQTYTLTSSVRFRNPNP